jgi:hypothetical protein
MRPQLLLIAIFSCLAMPKVKCQTAFYEFPLFPQYDAKQFIKRTFPTNAGHYQWTQMIVKGVRPEYANSIITISGEVGNYIEAKFYIDSNAMICNGVIQQDSYSVTKVKDYLLVTSCSQVSANLTIVSFCTLHQKGDTTISIGYNELRDTTHYDCYVTNKNGLVVFSRQLGLDLNESTADSNVYFFSQYYCELYFPKLRSSLFFNDLKLGEIKYFTPQGEIVTESCKNDTLFIKGEFPNYDLWSSKSSHLARCKTTNRRIILDEFAAERILIYCFDRTGRLRKGKVYNNYIGSDEAKLVQQEVYKYDSRGRIASIAVLDGTRRTQRGMVFSYSSWPATEIPMHLPKRR